MARSSAAPTSSRSFVTDDLGREEGRATGDLKRRLGEHNRGKVRSTASRRPLVLIYSESFEGKLAAMQRERFFKTPKGGALKQRLIEESRSGTVD
ncbi:MAG: GIY-YIG nuclease family protein [Chloroflexi bacterium]|nr:GIY-YIG nuclease family protein [Chloroflexota bacterium]